MCKCGEFICDKCEFENTHNGDEHLGKEQLGISSSADYFSDNIINFLTSIDEDQTFTKEQINQTIVKQKKMVDNSLEKEKKNVIDLTEKIKNILANQESNIIESIKNFKEEFDKKCNNISKSFTEYNNSIINIKKLNDVSKKKNEAMAIYERFDFIKEYSKLKNIYMSFRDSFKGFSDLSPEIIKSEFSFGNYQNLLTNFITTITANAEYDYTNLAKDKIINNINKKIELITSNSNYYNYGYNKIVPNTSNIYYPIDNTNIIVKYNFNTEKFSNINILHQSYKVYPYSRSTNINGKLYITGGMYRNEPSNNTFSFSEGGNKNSFIKLEPMNHPRCGHSVMTVSPNNIFVFGGVNRNLTCELYDTETKRWKEISSLNEERIDGIPFISRNKLYIFGGVQLNRISKSYAFKSTIEAIEIKDIMIKETWTQIRYENEDNPSLPRSLGGVVYAEDNLILIFGGQIQKGLLSDDILIFKEEDDEINIDLGDLKLPKKTAFIENNLSSLYKNFFGFDIFGDLFFYNTGTDMFHYMLNTNCLEEDN